MFRGIVVARGGERELRSPEEGLVSLKIYMESIMENGGICMSFNEDRQISWEFRGYRLPDTN
jgi:hypothetical protein